MERSKESKIKKAITDKLDQLGALIDSELPEYILVMISNRKSPEAMEADLLLFLDKNTKPFIEWLHDYLHRPDNDVDSKSVSNHKHSPKNDKKEKKKAEKDKHKEKDRERGKQIKESENRRDKEINEKGDKDRRERDKIKPKPIKEEKKVIQYTHDKKSKDRSRSPIRATHRNKTRSPAARKLKRISPMIESSVKAVQSSVTVADRGVNKSFMNREPMKAAVGSFKRDITDSVKSLISYEDICAPNGQKKKAVIDDNSRNSVFARLGKGDRQKRSLKRSRSRSPMEVDLKKETALSPEKPSIKKRLGESRKEIQLEESPNKETNFIVDISGAADLLRTKDRRKPFSHNFSDKTLTSRLGPKVSKRVPSPSSHVSIFNHTNKTLDRERVPSSPSPPSPRLHFNSQRNSNTKSQILVRMVGSGNNTNTGSDLYHDEYNDDEEDEGVITSDPANPDDQMNDASQDSSSKIVDKPQSTTRCRFWPNCKNKKLCPFFHPTDPCKMFPNCKFGTNCFYIHPNCRYDTSCTRPDCPFTHYGLRSFIGSKPVMTKLISQQVTMCQYYPNCMNTNCTFFHPNVQCKYGLSCANRGVSCRFEHPALPRRSELKWTRTTPTNGSASADPEMTEEDKSAEKVSPLPIELIHPNEIITDSENMDSQIA